MIASLKSSYNAAMNRLRLTLAFRDVSFLIRFNAICRMIVNQHAKMTPLGGKTASKIDPPLRCNITAG